MLRTLPFYIKTVDVVAMIEAFAGVLYKWQERADQRHALGTLDDRMLRDIGVDRMAVHAEIEKPFWRA